MGEMKIKVGKPKVFIQTQKEALTFVSEFLVLMKGNKSHEALIKNVAILEKRIRESIKNNSEPKSNDFLAETVAYDEYIKIVSNFIPIYTKASFRAYPPYVLRIRSHIFDKMKGTKGKVNAFAFPFSNCVIVTEECNKRRIPSVLIHEFLHYASELGSDWNGWRNGVNQYRPWVIEGITELYTKRLAIANRIPYTRHKNYDKFLNAITQIEAILGKENLKKAYFSGNINLIFSGR
jgi:hypothetical protein